MKRDFKLVGVLIVVAVILILAAILVALIARPDHKLSRRASCQSNLKQMGLAALIYAVDYDEKYPPVGGSVGQAKFGWADRLQPYAKSLQLLQCPSESNRTPVENPRGVGYTDYWMNSRLADLKMEKVKSPAETFLFGDGNDGSDATDARYAIDALPKAWLSDGKSPAFRHLEGANYAFVDGHVKWLKPEAIKLTLPGPTFAVR